MIALYSKACDNSEMLPISIFKHFENNYLILDNYLLNEKICDAIKNVFH
jgi:hypothetical protein